MRNFSFRLLILIVLASFTCKEKKQSLPASIGEKIQSYSQQAPANPPASVYEYTYQDQKVYFIPAMCCDNLSELYDSKGNLLCHPDGGLTGKGDGKCEDFFEKRKDEKLIWKDTRSE